MQTPAKKPNKLLIGCLVVLAIICLIFVVSAAVSAVLNPTSISTLEISTESIVQNVALSPSSRCVPATQEQLTTILAGVKDISENNYLQTGWAVKSNDYNNVWFVAAKIYGPGMENGSGPGVWSIGGESGMILSVDGYAQNFSTYPDASKTDAAITLMADGAKEAMDCASASTPLPSETPIPTDTIPPTIAVLPPASSNPSTGFDNNGDGKVTCADFKTQAAAQRAYDAGYTGLDGNDKDGKACESLP